MAEFSKLVITDVGRALLAKMISGSGNIEFTNVSASCAEYTDAELGGLTSLSDVKQTSRISKVTRTNETAVKVEAAFTNKELTEGYYIRALGLYAVDPDAGEILYAVTRETSGNCHMPAYNGVTVSGAYVQLVTTVGNAENVSLEVDSGAYATMGDIRSLETRIGELNKQMDKCFGGIDVSGDIGFDEGIKADNIVDAINEVFTLGSEKKNKLVENLTAMGVPASTEETWEALLGKVLDMTDTSRDTVTAAALLDGYTAHDAAGKQITGEMPEQAGATVDATEVTQDEEYTYLGVPAGHYDESSKVRAINSDIYQKNVKRVDVVGAPKNIQMTVPDRAKSGILMLCGSFWNSYLVNFSEPSGDGIISVAKLHDTFLNDSGVVAYANIHVVIYKVSLKSGGFITVTNSVVGHMGANSDTYSGTSMILLY